MKREDFICEASSKILSTTLWKMNFESPIPRSIVELCAEDAVSSAVILADTLHEKGVVAWPSLDKPAA
jgi:hypothetical protein